MIQQAEYSENETQQTEYSQKVPNKLTFPEMWLNTTSTDVT